MKLLILGATGGIGVELVGQAIERGHSVTAIVRSDATLQRFATRMRIVSGNLLNGDELAAVMNGHDAVLSGFGPRLPIAKSDAQLLTDFSRALIRAMHQSGVRRAVVVSTAFLFKDSILPPAYLFGRILFPGVVRDATGMEATLRASNLNIAIVRPPQLTDKPRTGRYRVRQDHLPFCGFSIPRADVAEFMIRIGEDGTFPGAVVGVCS